ncbi:DUF1349 domain-containing protein [Oerskovia flava]|uniref:beta-xylosidase family glycoside hydrolase n=1 Tax=Oerskovia flava TaxID=2986422 RepID=UPI00224097C6|nr:DUF1349 domain-containing protein [Oerskovia sp. JB1-3-2]
MAVGALLVASTTLAPAGAVPQAPQPASAAATTAPPAAPAPSESDLPVFDYRGVITEPDEMIYNPTDEFIFPSVFHAGAHLEDPLGEWYLYLAPHDDPGGIMLLYADSLEGPWTEYAQNPLISNDWPPHYGPVPHVSSPDAFWNADEGRLFLYFHGNNSTTRYATSADGVTFEYGGVAVTNADGGPGTTETSYARVFDHPDPDSAYRYAMFYMQNRTDDIRRIKVAESVDGRDWDVRADPLVVPGWDEGQNVSGADLWEWQGQLYVVYHGSTGIIHARTVDPTLTDLGPVWTLHRSSGTGEDTGRVAAPQIVTDGADTYLFYESGARLTGVIAWAKRDLDAVRPPQPAPDPDPLREQCRGAASDEFDGDELGAPWALVRAETSRHEVADGTLTIPTYASGVAGAAFPLQPVPDGAWEVTTQLEIEPTQAYQQAGILLYRNDSSYAKIDFNVGQGGLRFSYLWRNAGVDRNASQDSRVVPAGTATTVWVRLASDGEQVRSFASIDGVDFREIGRPVPLATLAPTGVGLSAMRGTTGAPEITASFDWFRWTPSEAEAAECATGEPAVEATSQVRCLAGRAYVAVSARNVSDGPVAVRLATAYGERTVHDVAPGASVYQAFGARAASVGAGSATVMATPGGAHDPAPVPLEVPYAGLDCD